MDALVCSVPRTPKEQMCNLAATINAHKRNTYTSLPKIGPFVIKGSLIFGNVPDMKRHLIRGLSSHMQLELTKEEEKHARAHAPTTLIFKSGLPCMPPEEGEERRGRGIGSYWYFHVESPHTSRGTASWASQQNPHPCCPSSPSRPPARAGPPLQRNSQLPP